METYINAPRYPVSVDCVIFGYEDEELKVLLCPRLVEPNYGAWSLMGGFVMPDESMDQAAIRVLKNTVGLENIYLEQVKTFSEPDRDSGGRVISQAYFALIRISDQDRKLVRSKGAHWWELNQLPELIFDHKEMVDESLRKLQSVAFSNLIGHQLLPEKFTLSQLHKLYSVIFGRDFDSANFRKKILATQKLQKLDEKDTITSKKGAFYYRFTE
ncbi:MAG: NUDIX hydrolase [Bacteroidales bacterium]|nr:NUDIX hydrolase [Bacteroidales bacterium]